MPCINKSRAYRQENWKPFDLFWNYPAINPLGPIVLSWFILFNRQRFFNQMNMVNDNGHMHNKNPMQRSSKPVNRRCFIFLFVLSKHVGERSERARYFITRARRTFKRK